MSEIGNYESVILQINGGTNRPSLLEERELFINTATGELYYGNSNETNNVNGVVATRAVTVGNSMSSPTYLNGDSDEGRIGGFKFSSETLEPALQNTKPSISNLKLNGCTITGGTISEVNSASINNIDFISIVGNHIKVQKVELGQGVSYGNALPATGAEGQIFFKIS